MKIGILTYHRAHNYGALLQAIATRIILKRMGHDVSYIDYWPKYHKKKYDIFSMRKLRVGKLNYIKTILLYYPVLKKRINSFNADIEKYIQPYCSEGIQYDAIIYGSDQIWRKQSELNDFDLVYFAAGPYKASSHIAFAASMGNVDKSLCARLKDYWTNFSSIGVREEDLLDCVRNNGFQCELNCDPTMLLTSNDWDEILKTQRLVSDDYVLYYSLNKTAFDRKAIERYADERGLRLIEICGGAETERNGVYPCADIKQFASFIKYADTVFASSFHGLVFSLLYHRKVYVSNRTNTMRLKLLLGRLGLDNLFVPPSCEYFPNIEDIYSKEVDMTIKNLKAESLKYLKNSLNNLTHE